MGHTRAVKLNDSGAPSYVEQRGLRELSFDGVNLTSADAPEKKVKFLLEAAHRLLSRTGEESFQTVLKHAREYNSHDPERHVQISLREWLADIIRRRGVLSPVTLAAKFLIQHHSILVGLTAWVDGADKDQITDEAYKKFINAAPDLFGMIYHLCDAWYWFRLELEGNHTRLIEARGAEASRQKGADVAKALALKRSAIILEVIRKRPSLQNKAVSFIAKNVRPGVEAAFKAAGLAQETEQSDEAFERMVRRALRKQP